MYYKIENKESDIYKSLHDLRTKELQISDENVDAIKAKTNLNWKTFLGHDSQQNFRRVTQFTGFKFTEPEKVCLKTWKVHDEYSDTFIPNKKTKLGREMSDFLLNGLKSSNYNQVFDILNLERSNSFNFPFVEIINDLIVLWLGDKHEPVDENIIEITKKEFDALLSVA